MTKIGQTRQQYCVLLEMPDSGDCLYVINGLSGNNGVIVVKQALALRLKLENCRRCFNMCEATAYILRNGQEELLLPDVDLIEPEEDGLLRLISIFGEQRVVKADFLRLNLADHKVILKET